MERDIYEEDHEAFRDLVKDFVKRHVTGADIERWDAAGEVDRDTMRAAGEAGIIGLSVPEEFGGAGMLQDYRFRAVVNEEVIAAGAGSLAGAFGIRTTWRFRTSCTWAPRSRSRNGCRGWRRARSSARSR